LEHAQPVKTKGRRSNAPKTAADAVRLDGGTATSAPAHAPAPEPKPVPAATRTGDAWSRPAQVGGVRADANGEEVR
jgi:hypothetical protein